MSDDRVYVNGQPLPIPVEELANRLSEDTLDAIRRGIPVSMDQALAAIAYQSLKPKRKKRPWYRRLLWWR